MHLARRGDRPVRVAATKPQRSKLQSVLGMTPKTARPNLETTLLETIALIYKEIQTLADLSPGPQVGKKTHRSF